MAKHLGGVWRLTRFGEYASFVIVTTLLGAAAGRGEFGWRLIGVLAANWLAVGFAFMINDIEDAPDDALDPAKARRNPVSAGLLSPRPARAWAFLVAGLAFVLFAVVGPGPLAAGAACLFLAFLYSWRPVRLKAIPVVDLISHAAMLAGLQFLAADWAFEGGPPGRWVFPLLMVLAISLYGQLFNELRDLDGDLRAGVRHTASHLGPRATHGLMMACLALGVLCAVVTLFVIGLFPAWPVVLLVALAGVLQWQRRRATGRGRSTVQLHLTFQKPVEIASAVALTLWFAGPAMVRALGRLLSASMDV